MEKGSYVITEEEEEFLNHVNRKDKVEQLRRNIENTCKAFNDIYNKPVFGLVIEDILRANLEYYVKTLRKETEKMLGD